MHAGWIVGGIVAIALAAMGRYERVQAWSRERAGRLYVGMWATAVLLVVALEVGLRGRDVGTALLVGATSGLFAAFGVWAHLVGLDYEVNAPEGDDDQPTGLGHFNE